MDLNTGKEALPYLKYQITAADDKINQLKAEKKALHQRPAKI